MKNRLLILLFFASVAFLFNLTSCKKTISFSSGHLVFSQDTVVFDTVFTTIGSTTKYFKIYNPDNQELVVDEIQLVGGNSSPFRINVDGVSGSSHQEINIEGKDSLFIFVEVTLDPNGGTLPMIVEDKIRFRTNGTDQYVQLAAWGQDMYYHYSDITAGIFDLNSDDINPWQNDKPHVIYGAAVIDEDKTLTIPKNTHIYLHKNAMIFNYKGTLNIEGQLGEEVTLEGDRLETGYDDVSGQYYGIYMQEAKECTFNYLNIKNATAGIHLFSSDASNSGYTLNLYNSIITNCARYSVFLFNEKQGVTSFPNAKLRMENSILGRSGAHTFFVLGGGDFNINHSHIVGYGSGDGVAAAMGLSNYYVDYNEGAIEVQSIDEGLVTNCVIYGQSDYEIAVDTITGNPILLDFRNNLIKSDEIFTVGFDGTNIWNQDPLLIDPSTDDYKWYSTSPLNGAADDISYPCVNPFTFSADINNSPRPSAVGPDIGAYEL